MIRLRTTYEFRRANGETVTVRVWRWSGWRKAKRKALIAYGGTFRYLRHGDSTDWLCLRRLRGDDL